MSSIPYLYKKLRSLGVPDDAARLMSDPDGDMLTTGTKKVVCVEEGTTGYADQPDGTLWVEYTP